MIRRVSWYSGAVLGICVVCAAITAYFVREYLFPAGARLVTEADQIDLGTLDPGTSEFELKVLNAGRGVLQIDKVKSSCGCTIVRECGAILAGTTGVVRGTIGVESGLGSAKLLLLSNDPDRIHVVYLRWFGKGPPVVTPSKMSLCLAPMERCERQIRIVYPAGHELVCRGVSNTTMDLQGDVVRVGDVQGLDETPIKDAHTRTAALSLRLSAPEKAGKYFIKSVLHFSQDQSTYEIPLCLEIEVVGKLRTIPRQIFFGGAAPDCLLNRCMHLHVVCGGKASDISVLSKPDFLECRFRELDDRSGDLEVRVVSKPPSDARHFSISLGDQTGESATIHGTLIYSEAGFVGARGDGDNGT